MGQKQKKNSTQKKVSGLRIISGRFGGRRLLASKSDHIRPTSDRLRERIFSILDSRLGSLKGCRVADLFAGTGAMGIEALSRGASEVCFVEKHQNALTSLRSNIDNLGLEETSQVLVADATNLPDAAAAYDLVFVDPPYKRGLGEPALRSLRGAGWIDQNTLIVLETEANDSFRLPDGFQIKDQRKQGKSRVLFLQTR